MSTRCQIGFYTKDTIKDIEKEKHEVMLYKHWDGYPSETLTLIFDYIVRYFKDIKNLDTCSIIDVEYASAWFMYYIIDKYVKYLLESNKEQLKRNNVSYYPNDGLTFNSFGICKEFHADITYYYAITLNYIKVYKANPFKQILNVSIKELIESSRKKEYISFKTKFDPIKKELITLYDECDVSIRAAYVKAQMDSLEKYIEISKTRDLCKTFKFDLEKRTEHIIGYHILDILTMPFEDLPTKINDDSIVLRTLAKYRLNGENNAKKTLKKA